MRNATCELVCEALRQSRLFNRRLPHRCLMHSSKAWRRAAASFGEPIGQRLSVVSQDLFKKTMSADAIAGRKPYGITTRMMHCEGWKRRELKGLTENFRQPEYGHTFAFCLVDWYSMQVDRVDVLEGVEFGGYSSHSTQRHGLARPVWIVTSSPAQHALLVASLHDDAL